jgi:hypothetical protein
MSSLRILSILLYFILIQVGHLRVYGQIVKDYKVKINSGLFEDTIIMGGYLDGFNTFTDLSYYDRWENSIHREFEPMITVKITNSGEDVVKSPRLTLNNRGNWYDTNSIATEVFNDTLSEIENVLQLFSFFNNNTVHYNPANIDSYNPLKQLLVYGYGSCDISAWNAKIILNHYGINTSGYHLPHHSVNLFGSENTIIDTDLRAYYLKSDNVSFAGLDDILHDKYLISRTRHFGKNIKYDKKNDFFISKLYYPKNIQSGLLLPYTSILDPPPAYFDFDFELKPGEMILFDWKEAEVWHHNWDSISYVPISFEKNIIANGKYIYNPDFGRHSPEKIFKHSSNVICDKNILNATDTIADFVIAIKSPFPILDANISGKYFLGSMNDAIEISYSSDGVIFEKIKTVTNNGVKYDSTNIRSFLFSSFMKHELPFTYEYYLKFSILSSDPLNFCGLDSLIVESIFQVSRFFLPSLHVGKNIIKYRDQNQENERNIEIEINWQESMNNTPPNPPLNPVFPKNKQLVDSLYFKFEWENSVDKDDDIISDYEFFLSNREDMLFPLSPNFNAHISIPGDKIAPYYMVKETGWLNSGTEYFWKVRAKDNNGAWSKWSDVWSFTPHGIMRPINAGSVSDERGVKLTWQKNNIGTIPDFYKIYFSNETDGFYPSMDNFFEQSLDTFFYIPFSGTSNPKSFYRITACSHDGQESAPSEVIELEKPFLFYLIENLVVDEIMTITLNVPEKVIPYYYFGDSSYHFKNSIIFNQLPEWLVHKNNMVMGNTDERVLRSMIYNDSLSQIKLSIRTQDSCEQKYSINIETPLNNRIPSLYFNQTNALLGIPYKSFITTNDGDVNYGDYHNFEIKFKPDWLNYTISNDTIHLYGIPDKLEEGKSRIEISTSDSQGLKSDSVFSFFVYNMPLNLVEMYPNPLIDFGTRLIYSEEEIEVSMSVVNIDGSIIFMRKSEKYSKGFHEIAFDGTVLTSGIYFLYSHIIFIESGEKRSFVQRFIKL